jgi:hypothetical protein
MPRAVRTVAAGHLQPLIMMETTKLLVVHGDAFTTDQNMQAAITEPAARVYR